MNIAKQYAQGLYDVEREHQQASKAFFARVREALVRRGHQKLLPRIASAYEMLLVRERRREASLQMTPEGERMRVLLQLYRKLISANLSR